MTPAVTTDAGYAFTPRQFEKLCIARAAVRAGYYTDYANPLDIAAAAQAAARQTGAQA